MNYVQSVILPGETLLATGKTHWFIYVGPGFWILVSLVLLFVAP